MKINEAKDALYRLIKIHEDVCGISFDDEKNVIKVLLVNKSKSVMKLIPKNYEGYKVITETIGTIRALNTQQHA